MRQCVRATRRCLQLTGIRVWVMVMLDDQRSVGGSAPLLRAASVAEHIARLDAAPFLHFRLNVSTINNVIGWTAAAA